MPAHKPIPLPNFPLAATLTYLGCLTMENNEWLRNLQPTAGSKRPSPASGPEEHEVKKLRAQPHDDDADRNIPDENITNNDGLDSLPPSPLYANSSFPSQVLYHRCEDQFDNDSESHFDNFTGGQVVNSSIDPTGTGQRPLADTCGPVPYTNVEQPTLDLGELPDQPQLELSLATETWSRSLPYRSILSDSSPTGSTPIHYGPAQSRLFDETLPFMGFNSQEDLRGNHSQGHTTTPDVCSGIDACQSEQAVFSESHANEPPSQTATTSDVAESMQVSSDYDTCYGVVSHVCRKTHQCSDKLQGNISTHLFVCSGDRSPSCACGSKAI